MNENPAQTPAPEPPKAAVVVQSKREIRVVEDEGPEAYLMDSARFEHTCRIAGMMARASLIPKHLKGDSFEQTQANCFLIVNQAFRWQMDPFAVAPETYEVGGKLAFQGKLIAAVINSRGRLADRLTFTFNDAKGDALEVTASGRLKNEDRPRTVSVSVGQAKTANQMWSRDPHQKLIYNAAIKWGRRHVPEVILGVLTDDDAEQIREEAKFLASKPAQYSLENVMPRQAVILPATVEILPPPAPVLTPEPPGRVEQNAPEPPATPQNEVETFVVKECGKTLAHLLEWAKGTGNLSDEQIKLVKSFGDLPENLCKRLLRAKSGLRSGLNMQA